MREAILNGLNNAYVKVLLRFVKRFIVFLLITLFFLGVGMKFIVPAAKKQLAKNNEVVIVHNSDGVAYALYKDSVLPKDYSGEMKADPQMLIYENQQRRYTSELPEDSQTAQAGKAVPPDVRLQLGIIAARFIKNWDSFGGAVDMAAYRNRLEPLVAQDYLDDVVNRVDNIGTDLTRPDGVTGSQADFSRFDPVQNLVVQRYSDGTAYVTAFSMVKIKGASLVLKGKAYIRSYGLLLAKSNGGWKISRVAAQNLREVIE